MDFSIEKTPSLPKEGMLGLLSGILSNSEVGLLGDADVFRRYVSNVRMSTTIQGMPDTTNKSILYEIGLSNSNQKLKHGPLAAQDGRWQQPIRVSEVVSNQLVALNKKYSNFTGMYDYMDLSAIGYHLAKSIARYVNTGTLSANDIRCGNNISVRVLGVASEPITANDSNVFVPRTTSMIAFPATFNAIMSACNAYGSTVYTDVLTMDGDNRPIVDDFEGAELVEGCYNALRILLSMYSQSLEGPTMAYAIFKGFNYMNTVVGHTDEGGYIRTVLRKGDFVQPYGGIYTDFYDTYVSLPMPTMGDPTQITASVDSILLAGAAAVAVSDPCVMLDGKFYPRTYSTGALSNQGASLAVSIASDCGIFCETYVEVLGKIFNVTGSSTNASKHLQLSFGKMVNSTDRHLSYNVVSPYYWIEPTTILPKCFGTTAELHGYASLCNVGEYCDYDALPKAQVVVTRGDSFLLGYEHRTARTVPLLLYLQNHALDGLGYIKPFNFIDDKMGLKGGIMSPDAARDRMSDMGEYLWGRGQSGLLAPAEMTYIGSTMGVMMKTIIYNDNFTVTPVHLPSLEEICSTTIRMVGSKLGRISNGKISSWDRKTRRDRGRAAVAMDNARNFMRTTGLTGGELFVPSNTELVISTITEVPSNFANVEDIITEKNSVVSRSGPYAKRIYQDAVLKIPPVKAVASQNLSGGVANVNNSNDNPVAETGETGPDVGPVPTDH